MVSDFSSVDDYLAAQPQAARRVLRRVRSVVRKAVPEAEEVISYKIPTLKLHGTVVLHFAGWRHYYSIYPANSRMLAALGDELAPYLAEKSTLRFRLDDPVPAALIERIAKFRADEIRARKTPSGEKRRER
jgi:uncharacterized protein YdhG (YjbR/CyaY superfamily)